VIRTVKILLVLVSAGMLFAFFTKPLLPRALSQTTKPPSRAADAGQSCKSCHAAIVDGFASNIHAKSGKFMGEDPRATSCASCHAGSEKHANTGRKEDVTNPAKVSSRDASSSCLQCHSQDRHALSWRGSKHDRKDVSCLSCHSQHHSRSPENMLTSATTEDTCLRCHTTVRKAVFQRSTHLFRTEQGNMKVGCTSCHNPHGGEGDRMLVRATSNDTCYSCHAEKRGPFLWEHPPARENCMNCHSPHGASNIKLLTQRANLQCQQCHIHMLPRHSTLAGKALDIWTLNRGCVNCHSQVHGSNHPGGRTFTR
jgi:DmsE family decaheme c-type cytochrome